MAGLIATNPAPLWTRDDVKLWHAPQQYSVADLCRMLNMSRRTMGQQIKQGTFPIPYTERGRRVWFLQRDVLEYLAWGDEQDAAA